MRRIVIAIGLLCSVCQAKAQQTTYKFDFGTGNAAHGYIKVTPETKFDDKTGFGFDQNAEVTAVNRGGNALTGDFITGTKPFYFSIKLPDGNYDVKLLLGDVKGTSATTVRTECRRLMLENIRTKKGEIRWETFTVHVKDSLIRNPAGYVISKVKLKAREFSYRHWDNLLTLEFNDSLPKVCAVEISLNTKATTVFLAGNSTVVDQDREPWAAWGQMFPRFLQPGKVAVANYAESGETMKAFKGERRLEKIWSLAKPGDYLFIEFTHNDQKPGGNHLDAFTTYKQTIKEWIAEAKSRKMIPVLVTSMHRRRFDSTGHIINTLEDYPEAMRQTAKEENVMLIDLNAMSKTLYEAWGVERSTKAFVHYPANTFPGQDKKLEDNTHFSPYGAYELAKCIVSSIQNQKLTLAMSIKGDFKHYDPAMPLPFENFYWPLSPLRNTEKPDGN
ncbi:MAG TPA: rhamnogalacturonan acetylesterase [Chitinophagaceae bacterium]|jgi:lysophospholipase L1-like esterase|nr:rhamnogalacturonan acetylesterase [Chitinophagaceae bacterium]HMU56773.1 rhamnogalacturonan acetylesterase [Chitinophagaceae bacterium]